jgi:filamentous hemagglutinin family protein
MMKLPFCASRLVHAISLVVAQQAYAQDLPTGMDTQAGSVLVTSPSATQLKIQQSSDRAVLRWNSFDIGAGNEVHFEHSGNQAATLNVVNGASSSTLAGALTATGSVYLVNPHGITITPDGVVDTGGAFVASTLGVSANGFMEGLSQLQFSGNGGSVSNAGAIQASDVLLLGSSVNNAGIILAPTGRVALGSASQATLDLAGDGFLQVLLPADGVSGWLVENSGSIEADGGLVQLKAATVRTAMRDAINMPGSVRARSVSGQDGVIVFHAGEGGELTVTGSVDTTPDAGSLDGGQVSMFGAVAELDFSQLTVGARGSFHLGVNHIEIDSNAWPSPNTRIVENTLQSSIGGLLHAGTNVTLQANNDLSWAGGLALAQGALATAANGKAGDLLLLAGRTVSLGGTFVTYNSDWTLRANAAPLVAAERQSGTANINMFVGNTMSSFPGVSGHLRLDILAGGEAGSIQLPQRYIGTALTARIDPGVANYDETDIRILDEVLTSGAITLSGHLRTTAQTVMTATLGGSSVNWTTEKTGGRLTGGQLRFIENGVVTRFGRGGSGPDTIRLELGSSGSVTRNYGDDEPDQAALGDHLLSLAAHNTVSASALSFGNILEDGSISASGPGPHADVGNHYQLQLAATDDIAFRSMDGGGGSVGGIGGGGPAGGGGDEGSGDDEGGGRSGYLIDLSGNTPSGNRVALTITPRPLTASVLSPGYEYGSPAAAVQLSGVITGDEVLPQAVIGGSARALELQAAGFVFDPRLAAGSHNFLLTGIGGADAHNYSLDIPGSAAGILSISPRALSWTAWNSQSVYGALPMLAGAVHGVLSGDEVEGVGSLFDGAVQLAQDPRQSVGSYTIRIADLSGADAGNYILADSGNTDATHNILARQLTWRVEDSSSIYGSLASPGSALLTGVLDGDVVSGVVTVDTPEPLAFNTPVGTYSQAVSALGGSDGANYRLAANGNTAGILQIQPRPLHYSGTSHIFEYGTTNFSLPLPTLDGIIGGDEVFLASGVAEWRQLSGVTGSFADVAVGNWEVHLRAGSSFLEGAASQNYLIVEAGSSPSQVRIDPKQVTFELGDLRSTYGDLAVPTLSLDGVLGSDNVYGEPGILQGSGWMAPDVRTAVGNYVLGVASIGGSAAANYSIAASGNTLGTLQIDPRTLNWHLGSGSVVYGDTISLSHAFTGLFSGDVVLPELAARIDSALSLRPGVGTHPVVVMGLSGANAGNYVLASSGNTEGTVTITPRPLQFRLGNTTSIYGSDPLHELLALDNLMSGDETPALFLQVRDAMTNRVITNFNARSAVGRYNVELTGFDDPNYTVATGGNTQGTHRVQPKPLTYTTFDADSIYGTLPVFAPAALDTGGVLSGDSVIIQNTRLSDFHFEPTERTPVGSYSIYATGLAGQQSGNYVLDAANSTIGALTIHPKEIQYSLNLRLSYAAGRINLGPGHSSSDYGTRRAHDTSGNSYEWDPAATLTGVHPADLAEGLVSLAVNDPQVPVSSIGAFAAGTYTWTGGDLRGAAAGNYILSPYGNQDVSHTIRPVNISVSVWTDYDNSDQFMYGTTGGRSPQIFNAGRYADLVGEHYDLWFDTEGIRYDIPGLGLVDTLPDRLPVGRYGYVLTDSVLKGGDARNFVVSAGNTVGIYVTPRPLQRVALPGFSIEYGEELTRDRLYRVDGVLEGDEVFTQVDNLILDYNRNQAGTYQVRYSSTLAGADARNYVAADVGLSSTVVTIHPRALELEFDPRRTYGDLAGVPVLKRVLPEDEAQISVLGMVRVNGGLVPDDTRLDVGSYSYSGQLVGTGLNNYTLSCPNCVLTIAPKVISGDFLNLERSYGTTAQHFGLSGVLHGDDVFAELDFRNAANVGVVYGERLAAGEYAVTVTGLSGSKRQNYVLDGAADTASLRVLPRPLTFTNTLTSLDLTYGDGVFLATLDGVLPGDQVLAAGSRNDAAIELSRNSYNDLLGGRLDAGEYRFVLDGLSGRDAGNYVLTADGDGSAARVETEVRIAQRVLHYIVANQRGQYGNYLACDLPFCSNPLRGGLDYGQVSFHNLLAGDQVRATMALVDLNGREGSLEDVPPPGMYFQVVSGLTGAQSHNYRIAEGDNVPGILEITPRWMLWKTTSALYMPQTGLLGEPGIPTLLDVPAGLDVRPVVQAFDPRGELVTDWDQDLIPGAYSFEVVALDGEDAAWFQPLPAEVRDAWRLDARGNFVSYTGKQLNDVGVLSVFADSRLGMDAVTEVPLPQPPRIEPPSAPENPAPQSPGDSQAPGSGFGRNIVLVFDEVTEPEGFEDLPGNTSQELTTSTEIRGGTFSATLSNATETLVKFNVTGITLEVSAEQNAVITFRSGATYAEMGAGLETSAGLQLGLEGIGGSAESRVQAYMAGGVSGDLGGGIDGDMRFSQGVLAQASAEGGYKIKDGKLVVENEAMLVAGATAGVSGQLDHDVGSVSGGATVYSPGVIGASMDVGVGYSDGRLGIDLSMGLGFVLGGLELELGFEIDVGTMVSFFSDVGCVLGFGGCSSGPTAGEVARRAVGQDLLEDPMRRFRYLNENTEWRRMADPEVYSGATSETQLAYVRNLEFFDSFAAMVSGVEQLLERQQALQERFVMELETDPQAAIETARLITTMDWDRVYSELNVSQQRLDALGVKLVAANGKLEVHNR